MSKKESELLNFKINYDDSLSSVTPIFQCSAFSAGSTYFYSRKNNPNVYEFEEVIRLLEETKYALATTTGMSALYAVLDLLSPGDLLVINKYIYGCSYKLFQRVCKKRKIDLYITDLSIEKNILKLPKNIKMILFETPTNPFLKTINIKKVSESVKENNQKSLIVVDNTWATPIYQQPLKLGADISLHSGTKYFSGHSDVMGGILLTNNTNIYEELKDIRFYGGLILTPYHAWLLRRSMQTFFIRMKHHQIITKKIYKFLKECPQVKKVYYPKIDNKQLIGYGGIIFFELRDNLIEKYMLFSKALKLFGTGTGMACVNSMVAQPYTGSHASMSSLEKKDIGLQKNLVRLCFGLEEEEDIKTDLLNAFLIIERTV